MNPCLRIPLLPGLANPAPIVQTFYLEDELAETLRLDGIVTLVDAKHVTRHLDEADGAAAAAAAAGTAVTAVNEAVEQIAFADRIVVNKVRGGQRAEGCMWWRAQRAAATCQLHKSIAAVLCPLVLAEC